MSNRLALYRERAGLTRKEVAERTGISPSYYAMLENGERNASSIKLETAMNLCRVLGCTMEDIRGDVNDGE